MDKIIEIYDISEGFWVFSAERLKTARESLSPEYRSLKIMSEHTGISIAQLSNYLNGKTEPNLMNLKKLCLYLQVPADFLLGLKVKNIGQIEKLN